MSADELIRILLEITIAISAAVALVLALRLRLRMAFGATVAYASWALVPVSAIAVLLPAAPKPVLVVSMLQMFPATSQPSSAVDASPAIDYHAWLCLVWMLGMVSTALWFWRQQRGFRHRLGALHRRADGLQQAQAIEGLPAAIGIWKPAIVLPADFDIRYSAEQRTLMLAHEYMHIARGDLHANALVTALRCLLWFNPVLHLAARYFRRDQELACDLRVIARHPHARRAYGEAMFKTQLAAQPLPLGCHWGTHPLRERIEMLRKPIPSMSRWLAGSALVMTCVIAGGYAAWAAQPARAAVPGRLVDVRMQMQLNGNAMMTPRVLNYSGRPFSIRVGEGVEAIEVELTATARNDQKIELTGKIYRGGKLVSEPKLELVDARPTTIPIDSAAVAAPAHNDVLTMVVDASTAPERIKRPKPPLPPAMPPPPALAPMPPAAPPPPPPPPPVVVDRMPPPAYPAEALKQGMNGMVILLIDVGTDGKPTAVRVERSDPAGVFDAAAIEAAKQWVFAVKGEKAVAGQVRVPVTFKATKAVAPSHS